MNKYGFLNIAVLTPLEKCVFPYQKKKY